MADFFKKILENMGSILALVGFIAGAFRWLISVYFKQAKELQDLRRKMTDDVIDRFRHDLNEHKVELKRLGDSFQEAVKLNEKNQFQFLDLSEDLRAFVASVEKKFDAIETQIGVLNGDLRFIRGGWHGPRNKNN